MIRISRHFVVIAEILFWVGLAILGMRLSTPPVGWESDRDQQAYWVPHSPELLGEWKP